MAMAKVAILTIHGIGQQKPHYAQNFHIALLDKIKKEKIVTDDVKCFELEWQHLIEPREQFLASRLDDVKWKITRNFVLTFIGDAVSYAKDSSFYKNIHSEINEKLKEINNWLGEGGQLYILAHSLGTVIIFDYIYNIQHSGTNGNKIFKATSEGVDIINKLQVLFTFGSPLYIYSLQKYMGGKPIQIKNWINVYSKFDIIGYPVKKINDDYKNSNYITDKSIICGGVFTFWNPSSHITYFDSNKVLSIITSEVYKNYGTRN
jgi:hypothetical protein